MKCKQYEEYKTITSFNRTQLYCQKDHMKNKVQNLTKKISFKHRKNKDFFYPLQKLMLSTSQKYQDGFSKVGTSYQTPNNSTRGQYSKITNIDQNWNFKNLLKFQKKLLLRTIFF